MTYPASITVIPAAEIAFREIDQEGVVLNLETGTYYGLNPVGTRAWTLLAGGHTLGEVCDRLSGEFEVEADVLTRDVSAWLQQLIDKGLVGIKGLTPLA